MRSLKVNCYRTALPQGVLGNEKHVVFECPALQDLPVSMKTCFKHLKVMP